MKLETWNLKPGNWNLKPEFEKLNLKSWNFQTESRKSKLTVKKVKWMFDLKIEILTQI